MLGVFIELHKGVGPIFTGCGELGKFLHCLIQNRDVGLLEMDPHHSKPKHHLSRDSFLGQY